MIPTSLEEISVWTESELRQALSEILPDGVRLTWNHVPGGYSVQLGPSKEPFEPTWSTQNVDLRSTLVDAYIHLWLGRAPAPTAQSPWDPRANRLTKVRTSLDATDEHISPDLDPNEIAAVYRGRIP